MKTEIKECEECGKPFPITPTTSKLKRFCCESCRLTNQRRRLKGNYQPTEDEELAAVQKLAEKHPDWEYIGGYTGSDGTMIIRHKVCGYTIRKSVVTLRHHDVIDCWWCRQESKRKAKEKHRELVLFKKPVKRKKQIQAKECTVCGALFLSSASIFCSDECRKKSLQHYYNLRKEERRRKACTEESKSITLEKLYKRDGGICWICGGRCDPTADSNANNYPSIDHVRPISRGGKDRWDNIKLAHRLCNSLKGDSFTETDGIPKVGISL